MRFAALITNELHSVYRHRPAPRKAMTAGNIEYTPAGANVIVEAAEVTMS